MNRKAACIIVSFNHWHADSAGDKDFVRNFVTTFAERNPGLTILLVDNFSGKPYPTGIAPNVIVTRLLRRVGYAVALNHGINYLRERGDFDWYVCMNNDLWADPNPLAPVDHGRIEDVIDGLSPRTLYGSGWNIDTKNGHYLQWSAWLCISREILQRVGMFDERLHAAFEDFDYELRAKEAGYDLDTATFPIVHLGEHTRFEDKNYPEAWRRAAELFGLKHNWQVERMF